MSDMNLQLATQAVMASKRDASGWHPSPDELLGYHHDRLTPAEIERLREHLAVCPSCTRAVLDMDSFPDVEPAAPEFRVTPEEIARGWSRFRLRLPSPDTRQPWWRLFFTSVRFAQATAATLLLTVVGLAVLSRSPFSQERLSPRLNVALAELVPVTDASERTDAGPLVRLPETAAGVVLTLVLVDARTFTAYEVDISGEPSAPLWTSRDLQRAPEGHFTLEIPRGFLPAGPYQIRLHGLEDDRRVLLATYRLSLKLDAPLE